MKLRFLVPTARVRPLGDNEFSGIGGALRPQNSPSGVVLGSIGLPLSMVGRPQGMTKVL